jgi:hypothetical protein
MYWCLIYSYMFRYSQNAIIRESDTSILRWCPHVVKSSEGWELYIVTDGVIVGILLGQ